MSSLEGEASLGAEVVERGVVVGHAPLQEPQLGVGPQCEHPQQPVPGVHRRDAPPQTGCVSRGVRGAAVGAGRVRGGGRRGHGARPGRGTLGGTQEQLARLLAVEAGRVYAQGLAKLTHVLGVGADLEMGMGSGDL